MKELLLKDSSVCRNIQLLGICLVLFPFVMHGSILGQSWLMGIAVTPDHVFQALLGSAQVSFLLSILPIALLISYLIAGERADRTAEFMAYLPPSRAKILLSKNILCGIWMVAAVLGYVTIIDLIIPWLSSGDYVDYTSGRRSFYFATAFSMFGITWLFSCLLETPVVAFVLGILSAYFLSFIPFATNYFFGWPVGDDATFWFYMILRVGSGMVGFVGGWVYFVKRVEP